jgi:predicted anti-sigma-YlaC factor YlaD
MRQLFACRQERELISLRLDGELSELEELRLDAHLRACPDCRAYDAEVGRATRMLRAAPLEPIERPVVLPQRRRLHVRSLQVGSAAAVVLVATALGTLLGPLRTHPTSSSLPIVLSARGDDQKDLSAQRQLRRLQLVPRPVPARHGGSQSA